MPHANAGIPRPRYRYSAEDVAKIAGLSVQTIREHAREGKVDLHSLRSVLDYVRAQTAPRKWILWLTPEGKISIQEGSFDPMKLTERDKAVAEAIGKDAEERKAAIKRDKIAARARKPKKDATPAEVLDDDDRTPYVW